MWLTSLASPGRRGQRPVDVVAGPGIVGHRVPPVHGEQGPARPQRANAVVQDLLEVAVPEVVQDLGEHDQVETSGRPLLRDLAPLDQDMRKIRVRRAAAWTAPAATSQDSRRLQRRASISVSTPMEQPGFEGAAVPSRREQREADRVLAPLIPAVLEAPRVRGRLVHGVEVARPNVTGLTGAVIATAPPAPW